MIAPEELSTARLKLRKPRPSDAPLLFASYAKDPEVTRFLLWRPHHSMADSEAHIEQSLRKWESGSAYTWFLFSRANDELIGSIAARPKDNEVELGYVLARKFWRRGLMLEAITAIVDWAFFQPTVKRVRALCDVDNVASARLLEKAGFMLEQKRERWSIHPNISAVPRDCYAYVKLGPSPQRPPQTR